VIASERLERLARRIADDDVRAPSAILRVMRESGLQALLEAGQKLQDNVGLYPVWTAPWREYNAALARFDAWLEGK
jgi:hypothetical protein